MKKKKKRLVDVIMVNMLIMISLPLVLLGGIFVFGDYHFFRQERKAIQKAYIQEQEAIFKHEVEKAIDYIRWTRKQHRTPGDEQESEMLSWISRIRFHNKGRLPGFLFVRTIDGIQLMSISRPDLMGKDISLLTDPDGINSHQLFLKAIKKTEGGYADYSWFNPSTRKVELIRSFVKSVPELGWYVGAGFWLGDIKRVIFDKQLDFRKKVMKQVSTISLLLSAMFLLQYLVYRVMMRKMRGNFHQFEAFFSQSTSTAALMDTTTLNYSEFSNMANAANQMIEDRNKAEQALRDSENRYRSIIENIDEGYCEVDPDGDITFFNDRMRDISGYSREELTGMNTAIMLEEKDVEKVFEHFADVYVSDEPQPEITCLIRRKDGSQKFVGLTPTVIKDAQGNKTGLRSIVRDVDRQKKYEENLIYLAYHDALTGLKNRKAFYEQLQDAIYHAKRYGTELALIYIDIDKFKKVNDTLGHEIGDVLLLEIRDRLQSTLRKTDFVSRIGGDEFVVLVDNPHHIHPAAIAEKIVINLAEPYNLKGNEVDYISSSVGISIFPTDAVDMDSLVKKADQAMYMAKEKRNAYVSYTDAYK
jgi:diguanylate cyclase (GGDEF)-like protein/PAS domain S-box-containing protein